MQRREIWGESEKQNAFMKLLIAIASALINLYAFSCFGADDLQFEGKSMETWLNNLVGMPESDDGPFPSEETRQQALKAFQRMGSREYDYLVDRIPSSTENQYVYSAITAAFRVAGTNAVPAIPKLIALFDRGDEQTDGIVANCLGGIGTNAVSPLLAALSDKNVKVRQAAVFTLGQIGPEAKPAVLLMLDKLKTEELQVRLSIISSLGLIRQYPEKVIPVIIENLSSDDSGMRASAAFAISWFSDGTEGAAPALFKLLNDKDELVRHNAASAIPSVNLGKEYIPQLVSNVSNPDGTVRAAIAQALGKQVAYTNEVFPPLLRLTKDPDHWVRETEGVTLNQMGYKPPLNITALRGN